MEYHDCLCEQAIKMLPSLFLDHHEHTCMCTLMVSKMAIFMVFIIQTFHLSDNGLVPLCSDNQGSTVYTHDPSPKAIKKICLKIELLLLTECRMNHFSI